MKFFFEIGNRYAKKSDWTDFALTKFCLCAMGVLIGTCIPKKKSKTAQTIAGGVFLATYIPLMKKMFDIAMEMAKETEAEEKMTEEEAAVMEEEAAEEEAAATEEKAAEEEVAAMEEETVMEDEVAMEDEATVKEVEE